MGMEHMTENDSQPDTIRPDIVRPDIVRPDLSIIIVNWNVKELLRDCLTSIQQNQETIRLEVIVVDSASRDGSPDMVESDFPWVKLIKSNQNLGYPRGNNVGIKASSGRNVLILNPDTVVLDDALGILVNYLELHIDVGAVGPQLLNNDGSVQSSKRRFPSLITGLFESTWLESLAPKYVLEKYYAQDLPDDQENDVDWVTGACLIVPRHVIDHVGLFDEGYFMYSEELDWCRRINDAGWRIVYLPQAKVVHHVGKSSEQAVTERHINFQQAKLRYFRKHHGRISAGIMRAVLLANYSWQLALEGAKGLVGHNRNLRRQRVQAYWQVIRSGLRPAGY
jgi:N-acetylglucosaminyl-diphospho-decaprenol L-rhamnosyltransferase